jgi:unsaturated chondroitin disaccharide hydrolase
MKINYQLAPASLKPKVEALAGLSAARIRALETSWDPAKGSPVFTAGGVYTARGWTEWTQGFQFGSSLLQFDLTGEAEFLEIGRRRTLAHMAPHLSHVGVHDHGFNNVSTYGNLRRLMLEGKTPHNADALAHYETALKVSGAVQAARWTRTRDGGFICSFNGPHSLFADTIRTLRVLALAHRLGHVLMGEADRRISLLERLLQHADATARYSVYYGEGRDAYDVRGRVAHESIFNVNDGSYRCPGTQQGFSPFTTWTRGLAWIVAGFPEELEFLDTVDDAALRPAGGRALLESRYLKAAEAAADYYIAASAADGIPYWDTGAPDLHRLGEDVLERPADPFNDWEPVDSSAAVIAAQGLLRLGRLLQRKGRHTEGTKYVQAALTVANALFDDPYLSRDPKHQGLILHSVYHRPNGWDAVPPGSKIPRGESSMWGDYHARELALMIGREIRGEAPYTFFGPAEEVATKGAKKVGHEGHEERKTAPPPPAKKKRK